jgi:phage shock protein PspC (stress-responsive transcriptional regulator)
MNKTITINLAGIVFHIDEDAYEILHRYLEDVKAYFGTLEGGVDIQTDIESRIAEIFLGQLSESRQAIHREAVEGVIRQLGSVADIAGEEPSVSPSSSPDPNQAAGGVSSESGPEGRRLVRDTSHALIAGVCSGVAAYFEINPLWVRLAALGFFFGLAFLPVASVTVFLSYLVLWIALPPQANLENKGTFRKFFRSRKDKVLGGVAGGLAAFFNSDPVLIRILFVVLFLAGGSGLPAYLILWALIPEARTVSDELEMKGNPVTLSSIEDEVKSAVRSGNGGRESMLASILLFPFRALAVIFSAFGPVLRGFFKVFGWFVGFIFLFVSLVVLFSLLVTALAGLGLAPGLESYIHLGEIPIFFIRDEISPLLIISGTLTVAFPFLALLLLSVGLLFRRSFVGPSLVLILTGLFLASALAFGLGLIPVVSRFARTGKWKTTESFVPAAGRLHLRMDSESDGDEEDSFFPVELTIRGTSDSLIGLQQVFQAQGRTRAEADSFASRASYPFSRNDSVLTFSRSLRSESVSRFRLQRLHIRLSIPLNLPFTMDPDLADILENTLHPNGYGPGDLEGNTWIFTPGGLKCTTCPEDTGRKKRARKGDEDEEVWQDLDEPNPGNL